MFERQHTYSTLILLLLLAVCASTAYAENSNAILATPAAVAALPHSELHMANRLPANEVAEQLHTEPAAKPAKHRNREGFRRFVIKLILIRRHGG